MKRALLFVALVALGGFWALSAWQARDPFADRPGGGFDLFAFFEGPSVSSGTITTALVSTRSFTADFRGAQTGETFRLEERFAFPDAERLQVWTLRRDGEALTGTVETERADGTLAAPAPVAGTLDETGAVLDYQGIAPGGGRMRLHFRHHMAMQDDATVRNHVAVSKWGVPLATSAVTFAKDAAALPSPIRER